MVISVSRMSICTLYSALSSQYHHLVLRSFFVFCCEILTIHGENWHQAMWKNRQKHQFWIITILLTPCVSPTASYGAYPICKGCPVCSRDNGCVNCQPKLFLFLRRERMRQYGECLHDCPAGYYGIRSPELNICSSKSSPAFPNLPSCTLPSP